MFTTGPLGKILIVDDDSIIVDLLRFNLNSEGFAIASVEQAKDVDPAEYQDVRLIIADAMDQELNGIHLIHIIKDNPATAEIPVIICSENASEDTLIQAFDAGADDFVPKPFSLRELIARIKAVLRRHPMKQRRADGTPRPSNAQIIEIPKLKLRIDTIAQKVTEDGVTLPLTKTEYAILIYLIRNQNSFFSRNDICSEVWKDDSNGNARIVDTNISRLRKKLGESGKYIVNRYGLGYAFVDKLS